VNSRGLDVTCFATEHDTTSTPTLPMAAGLPWRGIPRFGTAWRRSSDASLASLISRAPHDPGHAAEQVDAPDKVRAGTKPRPLQVIHVLCGRN
jgi:hypothetical protein